MLEVSVFISMTLTLKKYILTMIACLLPVNPALSEEICIKLNLPQLPPVRVAEQVLRHEFAVDGARLLFRGSVHMSGILSGLPLW